MVELQSSHCDKYLFSWEIKTKSRHPLFFDFLNNASFLNGLQISDMTETLGF